VVGVIDVHGRHAAGSGGGPVSSAEDVIERSTASITATHVWCGKDIAARSAAQPSQQEATRLRRIQSVTEAWAAAKRAMLEWRALAFVLLPGAVVRLLNRGGGPEGTKQ